MVIGLNLDGSPRISQIATTLPVLPNSFPYNELLLTGKLRVGEHEGVKTRGWPMCVWKYRGPVLLYTSTSTHGLSAEAHNLNPNDFPRQVIVGVGQLVDICDLNRSQKKQMYMNFNNWDERQYRRIMRMVDFKRPSHIEPLYAGLFFQNLKKFKKSIPFAWKKGAVTLNHAPLSLIAKALKEVGYKI